MRACQTVSLVVASLACGCACGARTSSPPLPEAEARPAPEPVSAEPYRCEVTEGYDEDPSTSVTTYDFDAAGRVIRIDSQSGESAATETVEFEYDVSGRATLMRSEAWQENGSAPEAPDAPIEWEVVEAPRTLVESRTRAHEHVRITRTFDAEGRVARVERHVRAEIPPEERPEDEPPVQEYRREHRCTWDASGRPTSVTRDGESRRWTYSGEGTWPIRETVEFDGEGLDQPITASEDAVTVRNPDEGGYRTYRGRCEDAFFIDCSPAFAPPPPGGSRVPIPRLR